jgi:hypothetical protein
MSTRPLDSGERAAEDVARAHADLHRALDRYAAAAASLGSLAPGLNPHLLVQRVQTIRRGLNRQDFGDLGGRARVLREGVEAMGG